MTKLTIGLTGGIGSGKSEVAKQFMALGIDIIDADDIVRELLQPGKTGYQIIVEKFDAAILLADQHIDRQKLRQWISQDKPLRKWLEGQLHPLVRQRMKKWVENTSSPYCILVIPLLVENLPNPLIDRILLVDADPEQQKQRAMMRDQLNAQQITAMMQAQASRQQRLDCADDVIDNQADFQQLAAQIAMLHQQYLVLSQHVSA